MASRFVACPRKNAKLGRSGRTCIWDHTGPFLKSRRAPAWRPKWLWRQSRPVPAGIELHRDLTDLGADHPGTRKWRRPGFHARGQAGVFWLPAHESPRRHSTAYPWLTPNVKFTDSAGNYLRPIARWASKQPGAARQRSAAALEARAQAVEAVECERPASAGAMRITLRDASEGAIISVVFSAW